MVPGTLSCNRNTQPMMKFFSTLHVIIVLAMVPSLNCSSRCPRVTLANGRVRARNRGEEVRFRCLNGFQIVGNPFAACVRGRWNVPPPICVKPGCQPLAGPSNGYWQLTFRGGVATLVCDPGYKLVSDDASDIYCNGDNWKPRIGDPSCTAISTEPKTSCDFESDDLCGWSQDTSLTSVWRRNKYFTPSGHLHTGPSSDHTYGKGFAGYYMYIETSSPSKENVVFRLYSPVYGAELSLDACFLFWYHMYGSTTGSLKVYVKPESRSLYNVTAGFEKSGEQGNQWLHGVVKINQQSEPFQIIIEAVQGNGFVGDSAIDDVSLGKGDECVEIPVPQPITAAVQRDKSASGWSIGRTAVIVAVSLTAVGAAAAVIVIMRRRLRFKRQKNMAEDSDVRYLTSDEILDFNMARPSDDDV